MLAGFLVLDVGVVMSYRYESNELSTIQKLLDALNAATESEFGAYDGRIDIYSVGTVVGHIVHDDDAEAWVYLDGEE